MTIQTIKLSAPVDKSTFHSLPASNGVYLFKKDNVYLYIGKSNNIKARILSHLENAKNILKERAIFDNSNKLEYISVDCEFNALLLEASLIQKHHPKYNVIWKDGKSYLYIKVTKGDEYPKILTVRKEYDNKSLYFGPFSSSKDVEILIRSLRKVIPFCTQTKITSKACFYHKIGLCNPCPNVINKLEDEHEKKQQKYLYREHIRTIVNILKGNTDPVLKSLYKKLSLLTLKQDYESAISIRNSITHFNFLIHFRTFTHEEFTHIAFDNSLQLYNLLKPLFPNLNKLSRIECFDISNLSQKQATGSMVVNSNGLLDKSQYRKFKIKRLDSQSDFEMLEEVIKRRMNNKWPKPDLIILDGGRPQVTVIKQLLNSIGKNIPLIGIAKNPDRLVIGNEFLSTFKPKLYNSGFNLVRLMRDESHRFAKKYHLLLRERKII